MQNKYSLANAMAKDSHDIFGRADGASDADIVSSGALGPDKTVDTTALEPLSGMVLELANAGLKLNEFAQSLGVLRENVDSLATSLSSLKAADAPLVNTQVHTDTTKVAEFKSTRSEDRRITREAMTVGSGQVLDPVAALRYTNAHRSFDATATSEKSTTVLREESSASEKRLSKTLEPVSVLLEPTWLQVKTGVMNTANDLASQSPVMAKTVKTAEAVILPVVSPVFTGFFAGLGDTIKTRVTGNLIDVTLGKLGGGVGKLFKDKGFEKEKSCCCSAAAEKPITSSRSAPQGSSGKKNARKPQSENTKKSPNPKKSQNTPKKQTSAPKPAATKRSSAKGAGWGASLRGVGERLSTLFSRQQSVGFHAGPAAPGLQPRAASTNRRKNNTASSQLPTGRGPGLIEALERGRVPLPSDVHANTPSRVQPVSREHLPVPTARSLQMPASGVWGAMGKLESSAARRLGPLKYVDTALDVVQGVRNGDAKAVGAGLSTAGGAWAGASAGAAIGTLVFPGVGTAVGGAIGGLLGSEAGTWLGDKLFGSSDRLPAPGAVSKELNAARTDNVQVTLAPSIQITGVNPADAQQVVNQVIQALQFQCMPMVTDSLGIRRNAALADPPGGD
ncbi:phage tail tape measure protein [Pseudomonas fluorescens]|jgi:hypothetical protein|uniref:phage tail tape measure protein n=1 Tax=Pseudomonas TaxID=286 RepID=UPI00084A8759|nr:MULTISPECIES: phage tail tape measure protein [Pseudomonas]MBC8784638.1 phage tail tape measure protein [Pseudomonas fluorescens]MEA3171915.1 hypothetical protein [Pseudomonas sp.]OEC70812.1 phage tail tape measure protein [Pseudomonas sp. AP19]WLH75009.1 phage tail tape measure protein [Pseudomonas fluorescens]